MLTLVTGQMARRTLYGLMAVMVIALMAARAFYGVVLDDQADLVMFTQQFEPVYDEQMPVYGWVLTILMRLTFDWVLAPDLLKFAAVVAAMLALYNVARAMGGDETAGLTAALCAFLLPTMNEDLLREYTHSSALIAFAALALWAAVPRGEAPVSPMRLGLAFWGGILAKHSMIPLAISHAAAAPQRERGRYILAVVAALIAALPIYLLLMSDQSTVAAGTAEFLADEDTGGRFRGVGDLITSFLAEGALLIIFAGVAYWLMRRKGGTLMAREKQFLLTLPIVLGLYAVGIIVADVAVVRDRWLAPSLLVLAPLASVWVGRACSVRTRRIVAVVFVGLMLFLMYARATAPLGSDGDGQGERAARPYPDLVDILVPAANEAEALVFTDQNLAATYLVRAGDKPVYARRTLDHLPQDAEKVLLVRSGEKPEPPWLDVLSVQLLCGPVQQTQLPYRFGNPRRYAASWTLCQRRDL